jgi:DNA-binding LacI/PurR family transcriptional regulator
MAPFEKKRPVSIKDVARAAGVSHPTVSRALRGSPLVPPGTAQQIRRTAEVMGYKPSAVARSLVTRKSWTIGLVVASIADPFYGEITSGIEEVASLNGYSVILANSPIDPAREIAAVRSLEGHRVDGILVTASRVGESYLAISSEMQIPIVLINNQHDGEFVYSVCIDNIAGAVAATKHLIELGHNKIAYLGDRLGFQTDKERYAGYRKALADDGIPFHKDWVVYGDGLPEGSAEAVERLLSLSRTPTALFCYNDMSALGAIEAARNKGLRVPEELSLIGFDDLFFSRYMQPGLTTIRQPRREMGRKAMGILLSLLAGEDPEKQVSIHGELVVRSSSKPPRSSL